MSEQLLYEFEGTFTTMIVAENKEEALENHKEVLLDLQEKYVEMMDDKIFKVVECDDWEPYEILKKK